MTTSSQNESPPTKAPSAGANNKFKALAGPIWAAVLCWIVISLGFLGLNVLMHERPQFTGQPVRFSQTELVQESPAVRMRKVSDDVSAVMASQPRFTDVALNLKGRRDYRGLKTVIDMTCEFQGRYFLTNSFEEPIFVLFTCPHPKAANGDFGGVFANGLKLTSSADGIQEARDRAWLWSGTIEPHQEAEIAISYRAANLNAVRYQTDGQNAGPIQAHRVSMRTEDLPSVWFESSEGRTEPVDQTVVWERSNFLSRDYFSARLMETRNLFSALLHLTEIGPLVCLLFLVATLTVLVVRYQPSVVQVLTLCAGFGIYFPLVVYLSSRFSFAIALMIAAAAPGILLLNYARWLLGFKIGLLGGGAFLLLYQIFPTLAAFAGWNRGMVLLCIGFVTLSILIHLQNQAFKSKAAALGILCLLFPGAGNSQEVQVTFPANLIPKELSGLHRSETLISIDSAKYQAVIQPRFIEMNLTTSVEVVRAGEDPIPFLNEPVYLTEEKLPEFLKLVASTNGLHLFALTTGKGDLSLTYRVPVEVAGSRYTATAPTVIGASGGCRIESSLPSLDIRKGTIWKQTKEGDAWVYETGIMGGEPLVVEWNSPLTPGSLASETAAISRGEFYGIGIRRARHLTVVNSNGSCTHFAEYELPAYTPKSFEVGLPEGTRMVSVAVNDVEVAEPRVEQRTCQVDLDDFPVGENGYRVSIRLAYPEVRLGFIGFVELELPTVAATVGTLDWIIALPDGFETQVMASELETQSDSPDLAALGEYGRILKSHPHLTLARNLVPPGPIRTRLKYRQSLGENKGGH